MPLLVGEIKIDKTVGGYEVIRNFGRIKMVITPWGILRVDGAAKRILDGNIVNIIEIGEPYCEDRTCTTDVVRVAEDHSQPFTVKIKELIPYYSN